MPLSWSKRHPHTMKRPMIMADECQYG